MGPIMSHPLTASYFNRLSKEIRQQNDKWWRNPATHEKIKRNKGEMLMLMVSELAEAMEGARKDLPDDHLPQYPMETVELADMFIRMMDYVGEHCPQFGEALIAKMKYNEIRADHSDSARLETHGKKF